jgi:hypothetical protein
MSVALQTGKVRRGAHGRNNCTPRLTLNTRAKHTDYQKPLILITTIVAASAAAAATATAATTTTTANNDHVFD